MKLNFEDFKKNISGKKVAVVGIGVSNTPIIKMLVSLGAQVVACDKKEDIGDTKTEFENIGVKLSLGQDYLKAVIGCDVIFRTPSMRLDNEYLVEAKNKGAYITSEMEEFLKYCPCKVFGVTGSDGKTTTTSLIYEMFKAEGRNVFLGGNIGSPLFNRLPEIKEDDVAVAEISSFQLMGCRYSPSVSAITNLSPNHMDIHKDMNEYVNSKKNIFLHQDKDGVLILNEDNDITSGMTGEASGTVRMFSLKDKNAFAHYDGEWLVVNGEKICRAADIRIPGMHNVANMLTAFSVVYGYVSKENMAKVAKTFKGVEHRIEFVRELDGVKYYNDAIATSPTRALMALKYFKKNVILIAGGYDKKIPFDVLAKEGIDAVKVLIVMGATKDKIRTAFENEMKKTGRHIDIIEAISLEEAVDKARKSASAGDVITLSPACASFDLYKNFEVKGKAYKKIVNSLK